MHSVSNAAIKAHRVPILCGYSPEVDKETFRKNLPVPIIGCLTGIIFGGIHCIAWDFTFPTYIEQLLWRVASFGVTVMPALALLIVLCAYLVADTKTTEIPYPVFVIYSVGTVYVVYGSFRLVLIVIMLISLRSLPAGVYDEVCWTSLIPHWY